MTSSSQQDFLSEAKAYINLRRAALGGNIYAIIAQIDRKRTPPPPIYTAQPQTSSIQETRATMDQPQQDKAAASEGGPGQYMTGADAATTQGKTPVAVKSPARRAVVFDLVCLWTSISDHTDSFLNEHGLLHQDGREPPDNIIASPHPVPQGRLKVDIEQAFLSSQLPNAPVVSHFAASSAVDALLDAESSAAASSNGRQTRASTAAATETDTLSNPMTAINIPTRPNASSKGTRGSLSSGRLRRYRQPTCEDESQVSTHWSVQS